MTISVIVLGYTRFAETTALCLASLAQDPQFPGWELVLVDNGSSGADRAGFDAAARQYPGIALVRLERNVGYPGGINAGLRRATGDPLILLTSDVLVPSGTIARLADALRTQPRAGIVAPVTNYAGNEQKIYSAPGQSVSEILSAGKAFVDAGEPCVLTAYRLDFCCAALSRAAFSAVGAFDEAFSPGYYEDIDYSLRLRQAGFDLLVAENAFVCHEGGATFGGIGKEKKVLIAANKQRFLAKHGHDTQLPHIRDANLAMLRQYGDLAAAGTPPPPLRIANRLELGNAIAPRGLLKRWRYRRAQAKVQERLAAYGHAAPVREHRAP